MNNGAVGLSGVIDNDLIDNSNVVANLNKANVYTNEQYNYLGVPFVGQGYFEAGEYTAEPVSLYEYQNENIMPDAIETVDGKKYAELEKIYRRQRIDRFHKRQIGLRNRYNRTRGYTRGFGRRR